MIEDIPSDYEELRALLKVRVADEHPDLVTFVDVVPSNGPEQFPTKFVRLHLRPGYNPTPDDISLADSFGYIVPPPGLRYQTGLLVLASYVRDVLAETSREAFYSVRVDPETDGSFVMHLFDREDDGAYATTFKIAYIPNSWVAASFASL